MNSYLDLRNIKSNRTVMVITKCELEHYCWWLSNPPRNSKLAEKKNKNNNLEQSIKSRMIFT